MRSGSRLEDGAAGAAVRGGGAAAGSSLLREAEDGQICGVHQVRETHGSEGRRSWVCSGRSGGREGKRGEQRWPGKEEDCRGGCYGLRSVRPLLLQLREKAPG